MSLMASLTVAANCLGALKSAPQSQQVTTTDAQELDDLIDAADLLESFKSFLNDDQVMEDSDFSKYLPNYNGVKEYAFEESRSAVTVWWRNCTMRSDLPMPKTYGTGTTSIVRLWTTMGGGMTIELTVFNQNAVNQIKRQLKRLNVTVSTDSNEFADVLIDYDSQFKCWTMSCNQFCSFISGE